MVAAILFSRMIYSSGTPTSLAEIAAVSSGSAQNDHAPLFVMPQVSVSAQNGAGSEESADTATGMHAASGTDASANAPTPSATGVATQPVSAPVLNVAASLVANLTTGATYASANADRRWPTASLAKLMSATIVADKLDPTTQITITENMFAADLTEQTLVTGGTYTVSDLLYLMLLPSSNVAAEAAATFYGRDAFVAEMNARAAAWGMASTHFDDPSGISAGDQSTANDFLKLAQKVYIDYPQLFAITRTPQHTITEENIGTKFVIKSINNFSGEADFVGGKTGHTDQAGGNLLSVFRNGSRIICVVVLGSDDRFGDTQKLYNWYKTNAK